MKIGAEVGQEQETDKSGGGGQLDTLSHNPREKDTYYFLKGTF